MPDIIRTNLVLIIEYPSFRNCGTPGRAYIMPAKHGAHTCNKEPLLALPISPEADFVLLAPILVDLQALVLVELNHKLVLQGNLMNLGVLEIVQFPVYRG